MPSLSSVEERIVKKVCELKDLLIDVAEDLIAVPTVNPPGSNYLEAVDIMTKWCKSFGLDIEHIDVPQELVSARSPKSEGQPRRILLAYLKREARPHIHLNGHYDVVPATGEWSVTEPYKPLVKDDRIYGRGATDMKGPLASTLIALKALAEHQGELAGCASLSAVPDEEIGGEAGAGYLVEKKGRFADACVIAEPSGLSTVWDSHKGQAWLEVTVKGRAAHASTPWLGVNAFERASRLAVCLSDGYVKQLALKNVASKVNYPDAIPVATLGGVVKGGGKVNIVPDSVSFTVDRRTVPGETFEEARSEFLESLYRCAESLNIPRGDIEVTRILAGEPCVLEDEGLKMEFARAVEDALGLEPTYKICQASLDMRHFIAYGIPTLTYGGGEISTAHAVDEYAKVSDLVDAAKVYALFAYRRLRRG